MAETGARKGPLKNADPSHKLAVETDEWHVSSAQLLDAFKLVTLNFRQNAFPVHTNVTRQMQISPDDRVKIHDGQEQTSHRWIDESTVALDQAETLCLVYGRRDVTGRTSTAKCSSRAVSISRASHNRPTLNIHWRLIDVPHWLVDLFCREPSL